MLLCWGRVFSSILYLKSLHLYLSTIANAHLQLRRQWFHVQEPVAFHFPSTKWTKAVSKNFGKASLGVHSRNSWHIIWDGLHFFFKPRFASTTWKWPRSGIPSDNASTSSGNGSTLRQLLFQSVSSKLEMLEIDNPPATWRNDCCLMWWFFPATRKNDGQKMWDNACR